MTKFTSGFALVLLATFTLGLIGCADGDSALTSTPSSTEDQSLADSPVEGSPEESRDTMVAGGADASDPMAQVSTDTEAGEDQADDSLEVSADEGDDTVDTAQAFVDQIQSAYQEGNLPEAIKIAEQARQALPGDSQLSMVLLQLLMGQAQSESDQQLAGEGLAKAERLIDEELASQLDPQDIKRMRMGLYYLQARSRAAIGELDEAIRHIKQARENGFPVEHLQSDPMFETLLQDETFAETLRGWMLEGVRQELASNEPFPFEFSLATYDDAETISLEDHKGKIVIVDFWGTWCGPCKKEIPHFIKLQDKYADDLAIVGINYENGTDEEAKQQIATFVQDMGINYPCVVGDEETQARVNLEGYPTTLFIDRSGTVRLKVVGLSPYEKLEAIVESLLAEGNS